MYIYILYLDHNNEHVVQQAMNEFTLALDLATFDETNPLSHYDSSYEYLLEDIYRDYGLMYFYIQSYILAEEYLLKAKQWEQQGQHDRGRGK